MITGVGIDIVQIARIENLLQKYDRSFLEKVFTNAEIGDCPGKSKTGLHYAGRWAAKEAFYKALPAECQKISYFKSVQILGSGGKPQISVSDEKLKEAMDAAGINTLHVSISHEHSMCVAVVILENSSMDKLEG
jgi:holo-[acyl-carrier protein] synthase